MRLVAALALLVLALVPAHAQTRAAPAEAAPQQRTAYEIVPARFERVEPEADLSALIARLNAAVAGGEAKAVDAELSPDFITITCYLDATQPCLRRNEGRKAKAYLARRPAQRIREDLCCDDIAWNKITKAMRDEATLGFIGSTLEPETLGRSALDANFVCSPAQPLFDVAAARKLIDASMIEREDLRVAQEALVLREAPRGDAPVIATLPALSLAAMVTEAASALPNGWTAIAAPDGRLGFTDQLALGDLNQPALCFARDAAGAWKIAAAIERKY